MCASGQRLITPYTSEREVTKHSKPTLGETSPILCEDLTTLSRASCNVMNEKPFGNHFAVTSRSLTVLLYVCLSYFHPLCFFWVPSVFARCFLSTFMSFFFLVDHHVIMSSAIVPCYDITQHQHGNVFFLIFPISVFSFQPLINALLVPSIPSLKAKRHCFPPKETCARTVAIK